LRDGKLISKVKGEAIGSMAGTQAATPDGKIRAAVANDHVINLDLANDQ